jgi:hypothetical protein
LNTSWRIKVREGALFGFSRSNISARREVHLSFVYWANNPVNKRKQVEAARLFKITVTVTFD